MMGEGSFHNKSELCHAESLCQTSLENQLKTMLQGERHVKKHRLFTLREQYGRRMTSNK